MVADGHEGVMAKHQTSRYLPGRRSAAWKKIKPTDVLPCVIIGYTRSREGIHSLLVASMHHGPLRYVGQITSGFSDRMKIDLERRLAQQRRPRPVVACPRQALWVEPDLYCRVRFQHWTPRGCPPRYPASMTPALHISRFLAMPERVFTMPPAAGTNS